MSNHKSHIDRFYLISISALTIFGFIVFLSASLGLLTQNGVSFGSIAMKQGISLLIGIVLFFIFSKIKYTFWRKSSLFIFLGSVVINLLLFIPSLAIYHGGASRWIDLGPISFQPSEFLKIAFIIYGAAWIQSIKERIQTFRWGLLPYIIMMAILGVLLLVQSDTDTLVIIGFTGLVMFVVGGMPMKHIVLSLALIACVIVGVIWLRPYALERVKTFINHGSDTRGAGYQINQSLIAIGSGQVTGRGFGQSVQKFGYLPQPTDDSIFAVLAEEFGFVGSVMLVIMYFLFAWATFRVAMRSVDTFGCILSVGFAVLVITESFLNISAMLGLVPLSGVPLLFVSHGGTALIITLAMAGIVANISKRVD